MSTQISADVSALFDGLGIDIRNVDAGLVVDRFELWGRESAAGRTPMRGTICRMDVLEAT